LGSRNLPAKSNFQHRSGFDAITGKANFDISEWMLIRLLEVMDGRAGALAMLCKSAVARKVLYHGWANGIALERSAIYGIDAAMHFGAAVDAVLLVMHFGPSAHSTQARVYQHLADGTPKAVIGYEDGLLLADIPAYRRWRHLCGEAFPRWRSGVKHDCSRVMELKAEGTRYRNGLGEVIDLEPDYVYPMLKSSDLAGRRVADTARRMLVTQRSVGQSTHEIARTAPKTWSYLTSHADLLNRRGSSIYRDRPPFSVFGVGDYTFMPWKVAISGFYKELAFVLVGPSGGKPVVLDDTCYFLPCETREAADLLLSLLNTEAARQFLNAFVFWDAKRPITADLLRKLALRKVASEVGVSQVFDGHFACGVAETPVQHVALQADRAVRWGNEPQATGLRRVPRLTVPGKLGKG